MNDGKKRSRLQLQLLFFYLPIAIIPLVLIIVLVSGRIVTHLAKQNRDFYSSLLTQVGHNIDFIYLQYARTLTNIGRIPEVVAGLNAPPYRTEQDEIQTSKRIIGDETQIGGLRNTVEEKIDGHVYIYELDRKSVRGGRDATVHPVSITSLGVLTDDDLKRLTRDPLFAEMSSGSGSRLAFGMLSREAFPRGEYHDRPVMLFPWTSDGGSAPVRKFFLILLTGDFIPVFYKGIDALRLGTLYILDRFNNVISVNHPGNEDYYDFDPGAGGYILGDSDPRDPGEPMTFADYRLLNTDPGILRHKNVMKFIGSFDGDETVRVRVSSPRIVRYHTRDFLMVGETALESGCRMVFFLPVGHIYKPVYSIITLVVVIAAVIVVFVIAAGWWFSQYLTGPVKRLSAAAVDLSRGKYHIDLGKNINNEIGVLSDSFKVMADQIRRNTGELEVANMKLTRLDKIKSLFLYNISHQLRTPLNVIDGFNELTYQGRNAPEGVVEDICYETADILESACAGSSGLPPEYAAVGALISELRSTVVDRELPLFEYIAAQFTKAVGTLEEAPRAELLGVLEDARKKHLDHEENGVEGYRRIRRSIQLMIAMIESVSDIARIDNATSPVMLRSMPVRPLLYEIAAEAESFLVKFGKKELVIRLEVTDQTPGFLELDHQKIKTVLLNLLSNAVKFSEKGEIAVRVSWIEFSAPGTLMIEVGDPGVGIKPGDLEFLFGEFYRTDDAYAIEGAGLGLALSKRIVDIMGGTIGVVSEYGRGSVFTVTVPAAKGGDARE